MLRYREAAGLSHEDLARLTGLTVERIDEFEHGWFDLTLLDLQAIALAVGATVQDLLDIAGTELGTT